MTKIKYILFLICSLTTILLNAQENEDYIEFNDRKNVVHGVYLGFNILYGEIDNKDTYGAGLKLAYVANQQFEVGFVINSLYSEQNLTNSFSNDEDLIAAYIGLHMEPIFFSKNKINLSFPLIIGAGSAGFVDLNENTDDIDDIDDDFHNFFIVEPGINALFNLSRYLQIEAGVKYRFTNKIPLFPNSNNKLRLNGFSMGMGIKVGVFNLGRNRYKKHLKNEKK